VKPGEGLCGYCESLLWAHCVKLKHGPEFCRIRERYYTDPRYGADEALEDLYRIGTPQQLQEAIAVVKGRVAAGDPPVPPEDRIGQDLAAKWLHNWRYGRNSSA
jgi:hypothetical protein